MKRLVVVSLALAGCATLRPAAREHQPAVDPAVRAYLDGKPLAPSLAETHSFEALYVRALAAHEVGDFDEAFRLWLAILDDGQKIGACLDDTCGDWPLYAVAATRRLGMLAGELSGTGPLKPETELAKIDPAKLPLLARRRLYDLRASYARRRGDEQEARRLDRAQGCPDRWFVAGPYGKLPRLDLASTLEPDRSLDASMLREAPSRSCQLVVDGPDTHQGVVYAMEWVKAKHATKLVAIIESDEPFRLDVDGEPAYSALEMDRFPAHVRLVELPIPSGWHRVSFKLAGPGGRADVGLALMPLDAHEPVEIYGGGAAEAPRVTAGAPVHGRPLTLAEAPNDPLHLLLTVENRLALGDVDRGDEALDALLQAAPKLAPAYLLGAQLALEDRSRPPAIAQDRARRALERALSLDPQLVRARAIRALLALDADRPREALSRLAEAPAQKHPYWRFAYVRHQALKQRGWLREAEEALAEARRLQPDGCTPLESAIAEKRERHDMRAALALARQAVNCNGGSDELADALRDLGDLNGAIVEYRRLLGLDPARESWRAGLAETLLQAGQYKESSLLLQQLAAQYPRSTQYRRQLADAKVALGDLAGARKALTDGLAETPESQELERALEALCEPGPGHHCGVLDPFRVDGKKVIADYLANKDKPAYSSPAVIVLDRTVTRVFPTGARLTLTHNVIQVLDKDGIDKWGEVQIPEGADVLTLRTIKADGSTREPEDIAEKQTVSVPDLEPGDFVELEYVDPAPPPGAFPHGFLAERFFFRSFDAPLDRTEYLLVTPAGMPVQIDRRGDAPELVMQKEGDLELRTWAGRYRPQAFAEPAAAPYAEVLPSVRAGSGVSFDAWKDYLRDQELSVTRSNLELRRVAARETAGKKTVDEKVIALDAFVRRSVRGSGALDEPATSILARQEGNRINALAALLKAAGIPSEVWLARPLVAAVLEGPLPDLEAFDQPLLRVGDRWLDPRYRHSPTGFVTPLLRGAAALRLAPGKYAPATVDVANPDDRQMDLQARLELDGSADVVVREKLRGWPALEWREALDKLPPDRVRPEFEQRTLGFYFPGSTLKDLRWTGENDDGGTFTVEYRFRSPQLARRIGAHLVLPAPYPALLGKRYVGVAQRKTPLSVDYAAPTVLKAQFAVPKGVEVLLPPAAKADGFGVFEQVAHKTADGLRLDARFVMPRAKVTPEHYRDFVDFAIRVDRAEARAAEIEPLAAK